MNFYILTHPEYEDDMVAAKANPITMHRSLRMPAISCDSCGQTWTGSRRLFLPLADPILAARLNASPLPSQEWQMLAQEVRATIGLPETFELRPGDLLSHPTGDLTAPEIPHLMHPFPGRLVMQRKVVQALRDAEATGVEFLPVEVSWSRERNSNFGAPPELYEARITGTAWRIGVKLDDIIACNACRRIVFLPRAVGIDETRWSATDFFNTDCNPNLLLVTERICRLLDDRKFTNYACLGPYPRSDPL